MSETQLIQISLFTNSARTRSKGESNSKQGPKRESNSENSQETLNCSSNHQKKQGQKAKSKENNFEAQLFQIRVFSFFRDSTKTRSKEGIEF